MTLLLITKISLIFIFTVAVVGMVSNRYDDGLFGKIILFISAVFSAFGFFVIQKLNIMPDRSLVALSWCLGAIIGREVVVAVYNHYKPKLIIHIKQCNSKVASKG